MAASSRKRGRPGQSPSMYAIALPTLLSGNARSRNAQAWIAPTIAME